MAGRLLASLLRTCETAACDQCWVALVRAAAGSSTFTPAAAVTTAAGRWAPPLAGHKRSITSTAAAGWAAAAATQPPTAAQPEQPAAPEAPPPTSAGASNQQQQRRPAAKQQQAPKVPFEQLQEQYQEQLSLRNVRDEANMMLLVSSARGPEQVQAAMDLLRWDKMVRARQQRRYAPFSPHATRALLRAGRLAGMGTSFAVRLLQEADELGMQMSQAACEDVVGYCIDKKDYWAAAEAWVYTRVYCADPSRRQPAEAAADAAGQAADSQPQQQQQPQSEGPLGWAGSRLVRTYAVGLAAWLQQGCVSTGHEQYVRQQLQQLVGELEGRGLSVPAKVKAALASYAAPAAAAAAPEVPAAAASSEPEAEAAAGPAAAVDAKGSKETDT